MRAGIIFQMEVPHREPLRVRGFDFGAEKAPRSCAIVGSLRGDEVQQSYVCARLVALISDLEQRGLLAPDRKVLIIPCANPFTMNVRRRFWPGEDADVNRCFPGDASGSTLERIAFALMRLARTYEYGIQLASFNQQGDFLPHVRVSHAGAISDESLELARDFGLPYVVGRQPGPYDRGLMNVAWQVEGTHAFSLYSQATDRIDHHSADLACEAVLRFLGARSVIAAEATSKLRPADQTSVILESDLIEVRTERAAGYLVPKVMVGAHVRRGQSLAQVLDAFDTHVLETLSAPCDGRVFFMRTESLVQQHMVVMRLART